MSKTKQTNRQSLDRMQTEMERSRKTSKKKIITVIRLGDTVRELEHGLVVLLWKVSNSPVLDG